MVPRPSPVAGSRHELGLDVDETCELIAMLPNKVVLGRDPQQLRKALEHRRKALS